MGGPDKSLSLIIQCIKRLAIRSEGQILQALIPSDPCLVLFVLSCQAHDLEKAHLHKSGSLIRVPGQTLILRCWVIVQYNAAGHSS